MKPEFRLLLLTVIFNVVAVASLAQSAPKDPCLDKAKISRAAWINCRVLEATKARTTQHDPSKQVQAPSVANNATSLVDQSAAPDLLGLAVDLAGLSSNSAPVGTPGGGTNNNGTSGSVTFTAYALYAAVVQHDPLDPAFYNLHTDLRRFSFTLGRDSSSPMPSGSQSGNAVSPTSQNPLLFGGKALILNWRDASVKHNKPSLDVIDKDIESAASDLRLIAIDVRQYLYAQLGTAHGYPKPGLSPQENEVQFLNEDLGRNLQQTLSELTQAQLDEIDRIIAKRLDAFVELRQRTAEVIKQIQQAPQLSFTFQSKVGFGTAANDYKTGLAFDYGLADRVNLTLNSTFDYTDNKNVMANTYGGRLAFQSSFQLNPNKTAFGSNKPILLTTALEGDWGVKQSPTYTGQFKLTIPIISGISLPLSFSVANRTSLIKEKNVYGNFGFTVDLAKLLTKQ
jgi:hypothetical protein